MPELPGFLSALKSSLGVGDATAPTTATEAPTLNALVRLGDQWLSSQASTESVIASLDALEPQLASLRTEIQSDLEGPTVIGPALRHAATALANAFASAEQALCLCRQALSRNDHATVRRALALVDEARKAIVAGQRDIEQAGTLPLCPRCGQTASLARGASRTCRTCGIHLVIPDPDPRPFRTVMLGPAYAAVFEACRAASTGERGLEALSEAVTPLRDQMSRLQTSVSRLLSRPEQERADLATEEFEGMRKDALACIEGLDQIRSFEQTLRCADLNRGWEKVAAAAACLARHIRAVSSQGGHIELDDLIDLSLDE